MLGTVGTSQAKEIKQDLLQSSTIDIENFADFNSIKQTQKADMKIDFGDHFDADRVKQDILSAASVKMGQNSAKYVLQFKPLPTCSLSFHASLFAFLCVITEKILWFPQ